MLDRVLCRTQLPVALLLTICGDPWGPHNVCTSTSTVKRKGFCKILWTKTLCFTVSCLNCTMLPSDMLEKARKQKSKIITVTIGWNLKILLVLLKALRFQEDNNEFTFQTSQKNIALKFGRCRHKGC